jgi:hypothetical protein
MVIFNAYFCFHEVQISKNVKGKRLVQTRPLIKEHITHVGNSYLSSSWGLIKNPVVFIVKFMICSTDVVIAIM